MKSPFSGRGARVKRVLKEAGIGAGVGLVAGLGGRGVVMLYTAAPVAAALLSTAVIIGYGTLKLANSVRKLREGEEEENVFTLNA